MSHTRYRYVGRDALPKRLSPTEVETYFTLTPALLAAIEKGSDRKYRLALAAQVAFLAATGAHPASTDPLPVHLMKGLCAQLGINETAIASIASINKAQRTVWEPLSKIATRCRSPLVACMPHHDPTARREKKLRAPNWRQSHLSLSVDASVRQRLRAREPKPIEWSGHWAQKIAHH